MIHARVEQILRDPKYHELVRSRALLGGTLSVITLAIYLGFIGLIAYFPKFLATPLEPGLTTTIGIPIGIGVIVSAFVLTGIYVWRANTTYDHLIREIIEDVKHQ
jgi:uncharacterized membrane protein (DUF485 family)